MAVSAGKESKKRRRSSVSGGSSSKKSNAPGLESVKIAKVHEPTNSVAVAAFGAIKVPKETEFQVFAKRQSGSSGKQVLVHGETNGIEYEGKSADTTATEAPAQYIVALFDSDNQSVELYPSAPYLEMNTAVKARKYAAVDDFRSSNELRITQRNKLGESFGTRKAKKAIKDLEVNRINTGMLEDVEADIITSVSTTTASLPSQEELQASLQTTRPIPPHNLETDNREEVYPLHGIIPKREWFAIRVDAIFRETDADARKALVPSGTSDFVSARLAGLTDPARHTERLQMLYYAGLLMEVFTARGRLRNKAALVKHFGENNTPPEQLVGGIIERFTSAAGGSEYGKSKERGFVVDTAHETKLLCYLLALLLRLENYILEVLPLASQLGLKVSKLVEVLRQMGCTIKMASAAQASALGLSKQEAATYRIATLTAPLKLPELVRRKRRA